MQYQIAKVNLALGNGGSVMPTIVHFEIPTSKGQETSIIDCLGGISRNGLVPRTVGFLKPLSPGQEVLQLRMNRL